MARRKRKNSELIQESQQRFKNVAKNIDEVQVQDWLKTNFIPYAWSYNLDRALVDVSGLKPVQRRILYTMYKQGLSPSANRSKVATLGGAVLHLHPHGDSSVVDALKNMARSHIFRVPLIDGKGDFGAPGKPGAAGRYIEARLSRAAWLNVTDIGMNAVKMIPNYDNTTTEPAYIPVKWPVGVINGGSGMAVAYASNIPSHNPGEIMRACIQLVRDPRTSDKKLESIIKGPDFKMGGLVTSIDGVHDYLETGAGTFTLRAKYEEETIARGATRVEFYEIPFGTYPEKILDSIQKQMSNGKLQDISEYKDLSDREHPIRIVVIIKPGAQKKKAIEDIFKYTPLQTRFSVNMTTIMKNRPTQSSMKDILLDFIEFRKLCVTHILNYDLARKKDRAHLIDGILKVLLDIDAAITIIRRSDDAESAKTKLEKRFKIDDQQADYVLSLQLRRLTRMDSVALKNEDKQLSADVAGIADTLNDEAKFKEYLINEFKDTMKIIDDPRCTEINGVTEEEFKAAQTAAARKIKAASKGASTYLVQLSDGSIMKSLEKIPTSVETHTAGKVRSIPIRSVSKLAGNASIALIGSDGSAYTSSLLSMDDGKQVKTKSLGVLPSGVTSQAIIGPGHSTVLICTRKGKVRHVNVDNDGKWTSEPVVRLDDGDTIVGAVDTTKIVKNSTAIIVTKKGRALRFRIDDIRPCGAGSQTIAGMNLGKDDEVVSIVAARPDAHSLVTTSTVTIKTTSLDDITVHGRGGSGVAVHNLLATDGITQAAVDPVIVHGHTIVDIPSPSSRSARPAPLQKGSLLSI
jgi:DNA gyrase subunit A